MNSILFSNLAGNIVSAFGDGLLIGRNFLTVPIDAISDSLERIEPSELASLASRIASYRDEGQPVDALRLLEAGTRLEIHGYAQELARVTEETRRGATPGSSAAIGRPKTEAFEIFLNILRYGNDHYEDLPAMSVEGRCRLIELGGRLVEVGMPEALGVLLGFALADVQAGVMGALSVYRDAAVSAIETGLQNGMASGFISGIDWRTTAALAAQVDQQETLQQLGERALRDLGFSGAVRSLVVGSLENRLEAVARLVTGIYESHSTDDFALFWSAMNLSPGARYRQGRLSHIRRFVQARDESPADGKVALLPTARTLGAQYPRAMRKIKTEVEELPFWLHCLFSLAHRCPELFVACEEAVDFILESRSWVGYIPLWDPLTHFSDSPFPETLNPNAALDSLAKASVPKAMADVFERRRVGKGLDAFFAGAGQRYLSGDDLADEPPPLAEEPPPAGELIDLGARRKSKSKVPDEEGGSDA